MLIACWSTKGGAGTTVVASSLAVLLAAERREGAALVDLCGDVPTALGLPTSSGPGVAEWLAAAPEVPPDALARLEDPVGRLGVVRRGTGPLLPGGADSLASLLAADPRPVVADCGRIDGPDAAAATALAAGATRSLLVLRPCFLGLRRAVDAALRPSAVVLLVEEGRSITADDVEDAIGAPVVARVRVTDGVARAVDAGLLGARLPRSLVRDLRRAA